MKIGLIACKGALPVAVHEQLVMDGHQISVIAFKEITTDLEVDYSVSLGKIGHIFNYLRSHKIEQIVLAGSMTRPDLWKLRFDLQGLGLAIKIIPYLRKGDDALLRFICNYIAGQGFKVLSIADLCPKLKMPLGCLTVKQPDKTMQEAVSFGQKILNELSVYDIGQSIAVSGQVVVGMETIEGTDAMMKHVSEIDKKRTQSLLKPVLVKMRKKMQSELVDLPTVGIQTIENLSRYGFSGAAFEADGCLMLDSEQLIQRANELGICIIGIAND